MFPNQTQGLKIHSNFREVVEADIPLEADSSSY